MLHDVPDLEVKERLWLDLTVGQLLYVLVGVLVGLAILFPGAAGAAVGRVFHPGPAAQSTPPVQPAVGATARPVPLLVPDASAAPDDGTITPDEAQVRVDTALAAARARSEAPGYAGPARPRPHVVLPSRLQLAGAVLSVLLAATAALGRVEDLSLLKWARLWLLARFTPAVVYWSPAPEDETWTPPTRAASAEDDDEEEEDYRA